MGKTIAPDSDTILILAVMALIYKEGGDKQLLLGLLILLIMTMQK